MTDAEATEKIKAHLERMQRIQDGIKTKLPKLYEGFRPKFKDLENQLVQLGLNFAKEYVDDIARAASDGFDTTKKVIS